MSISPKAFDRGASLSHKTTTHVPADCKLRPLRDVLIIEPMDGTLSAIIEVIHECKPVRGTVKAAGPGVYPAVYQDAEGHRLPDHRRDKRKKVAAGVNFVPTTVKVGEVVDLGGLDIGGYAFDSFYWGDKLHLICREADVAGIVDTGSLDQGSAIRPAPVQRRHIPGATARGQSQRGAQ